MYIIDLDIKNIRIIKNLFISNTNHINFILGPNAQGKSSILEALYILSTSKSHRTFKDREFININENLCEIKSHVKRDKRPDCEIGAVIDKNHRKAFFIDNAKRTKIKDVVGELNCVIFSGEDIEMIKSEPQSRRNFLNLEISQIYPLYAEEYANYKRTLFQRNNILKDIKNGVRPSYDILDILDLQLSLYGSKLLMRRKYFTDKIIPLSKEIYNIISDKKSDFSLKYTPNPHIDIIDEISTQRALFEQITAKRDTDLKLGTTSVGPHRDDIDIKINGLLVRNYGSQGEGKSSAFALKMAEIDIIKEITGEYPVVLLDDLMSELDYERREKAVKITGENCQIFITTTHLDKMEYNSEETSVYYIDNGNLM